MGVCASAPPLADSAELRRVERQYKAEIRNEKDEFGDDPTAQRARQAANRFLQFTSQLPSMAGKVVVVTGTTGGPLLVASTLAERGAYVILIASSPLRPEHKRMIETSMSEAVATYEEAGNIPEEHEEDMSRPLPEKNGSSPHAREESHSRSRRRHSNSRTGGNSNHTADRSNSANNSHRQRSRNGKNSRGGGGGGPLGESSSNELRVNRNTPIQMEEQIDTSAPPVARNSRIARTTREAQIAHRTSSTGKVRGSQGGARERSGAAAKRGYHLVSCDFQDLLSVHSATCSVLEILEQQLKCGVNIIVNMAGACFPVSVALVESTLFLTSAAIIVPQRITSGGELPVYE